MENERALTTGTESGAGTDPWAQMLREIRNLPSPEESDAWAKAVEQTTHLDPDEVLEGQRFESQGQ